jgi:hypothetical protein
MMNHMKALAILAFCYKIEAAALPQLGALSVPAISLSAAAELSAAAALSVAVPTILPVVTKVSVPSVPGMSSSFFFILPTVKNKL